MSQTPQIDINALWRWVTDQVKAKVSQPGVWRAMEAGKPLALEDDELIVGYGPEAGMYAGQLGDNQLRNLIEQALLAGLKRRFRLHVFIGETREEWETHKQAQIEAQKLQQQARQQFRQQAEQGQTWDAVSEQLVRRFSEMQNRGLASVQGRYLDEALGVLAEAYPRLMSEKPSEQDERLYSRALERVAERANVPAALISQIVWSRCKPT